MAICNQISPKNSDVEVFTFTKITLHSDKVELACFNSTLFYRAKLNPASLELPEQGVTFLIKTELLSSTVGLIQDEIVGLSLDMEKTTLVLQGSSSKHTLRINLDSLDNFVAPERKTENVKTKVKIEAPALLNADKIAQVSVGNPRTVYQPEFLNVCYDLNPSAKQMVVVSTDRYRMVKILLDAEFSETSAELENGSKNFLLNPKNLNILSSAVGDQKEIELTFESESLWAKLNEAELVMRYGDGTYPDYNKILPQSFACHFLVNAKEVLDALKQVFYLARMNSNNKSMTIQVKPEDKQLTFSATTGDGYSSESSVDIFDYEGSQEAWSQSFNAEYLIDYIGATSAEKLLWEANPSKPSVLSPQGEKDKQLYLVSGLK